VAITWDWVPLPGTPQCVNMFETLRCALFGVLVSLMGVQKMGNPETTNQLPLLSLESQRRIAHLHYDARVRLGKTLDTLTSGRSERLKIDGNLQVHEIVIAYAVELLKIAAPEYKVSELQPDRRRAVMLTLANRIYAETSTLSIPQCRVDLGELRHDTVFKKRLWDELGRLSAPASSPAGEKCGESNAASLVNGYLEREHITVAQFANRARVDPSVIYAVRRGKKRGGPEPLQRIATLLGCDVKELLPRSGVTATASGKAGV
jgi:hypothetical protein